MNRRPAKPGEWWFALSFLCLLLAPVLLMITLETQKKIAALEKDSFVAAATVIGRRMQEHTKTGTKNRTLSTTSYLLTLSYDLMSKNRFADSNAGKAYLPSKDPVLSTGEIEVSRNSYDQLPEGHATLAAYLPGQADSLMLADEAKRLAKGVQTMIQGAIVVLALALGLFAAKLGFTARRAARLAAEAR